MYTHQVFPTTYLTTYFLHVVGASQNRWPPLSLYHQVVGVVHEVVPRILCLTWPPFVGNPPGGGGRSPPSAVWPNLALFEVASPSGCTQQHGGGGGHHWSWSVESGGPGPPPRRLPREGAAEGAPVPRGGTDLHAARGVHRRRRVLGPDQGILGADLEREREGGGVGMGVTGRFRGCRFFGIVCYSNSMSG